MVMPMLMSMMKLSIPMTVVISTTEVLSVFYSG